MGVRARWRVVVLVVATLASGCVESSREVAREAQARGGGVTADLVLDAVDAVDRRQGDGPVELRSVSVAFTQVALEVGVPADEDDADDGDDGRAVVAYEYGTSGRFGAGGLEEPRAVVRSSTEAPLGPSLFTVDEAGVERLDEMVDTALRSADLEGGYVAGVTIARPREGGEPRTEVTVTDGRRTVHLAFGPDAEVVEVRT